MLDKKKLLALPNAPVTRLDLPEYGEGEHVYVRSMSTSELLTIERKYSGEKKAEQFNAALFHLSICDAEGKRVFDSEHEASALLNLPHGTVKRIQDACLEANGLGEAKKN